MSRGIIIGLSVLSAGLLVAAIAAPLAIQSQNTTELNKLQEKIVSRVQLTEAGTTFFNEVSTANPDAADAALVTVINTELDKTENTSKWASWFEVISEKGDIIAPPEGGTLFTITDLSVALAEEEAPTGFVTLEPTLTLSNWDTTLGLSIPSTMLSSATVAFNVERSGEETPAEPITLEFAEEGPVQTEILKYIPNVADVAALTTEIEALTTEELIAIKDVVITSANKTEVTTVEITAAAGTGANTYALTFTFTAKDGVELDTDSKATTITITIPAPEAPAVK